MLVLCTRTVHDELLAYCAATMPEEACGVLLGSADRHQIRVAGFEGMPNRASEPTRSFLLDPAEWIRFAADSAESSISDTGTPALVGLFHSHPVSEPVPSKADLASEWQLPTYWIAGFPSGNFPLIRAYCRSANRFEEQLLLIVP